MSAATILSSINTPNSPILISPVRLHHESTKKLCNRSRDIRDTEEFRSNLCMLSESFKHIPNELITSLLESVSNDANKAQCLIKQISDASCTHVSHKKRNRPEWSFDSCEPEESENSTTKSTPSSSMFSHQNVHEEEASEKLLNSTSGDSTLLESASILSCPKVPINTNSKQPDSGAGVVVQTLSDKLNQMKKIQKVLAKVVANQFEKMNVLQTQNLQLTSDQNILKQQIQQLQVELQQANHKNTVLSYMVSTFNSTQSLSHYDHNRPIF